MKKIIFIFSCFLFIQSIVLANYNEIFIADIQYDWIDKSLIEKNEIISEIKDLIFKEESLPKKEIPLSIASKLTNIPTTVKT